MVMNPLALFKYVGVQLGKERITPVKPAILLKKSLFKFQELDDLGEYQPFKLLIGVKPCLLRQFQEFDQLSESSSAISQVLIIDKGTKEGG
jgi:hypothetical protein